MAGLTIRRRNSWCSLRRCTASRRVDGAPGRAMVGTLTESSEYVVLEIGCFTGYSALAWACAVSDHPDCEVW